MLREIITPRSNEHIVHIPPEYINTRVEILVLPFSKSESRKIESNAKDIFSKTAGLLSDQSIDPIAWQDEIRSEWDR